MTPFHHALLNSTAIIPQHHAEIYDAEIKLVQGTDTAIAGFYFFQAYKTSNFSSVVCDKDYFFLYSTHHAPADGAIYWGRGDNLDLSDFQEVAIIKSGNQSETPYLIEIGGTLFFYYHTAGGEAGNDSKQQTRLMTSPGGAELHLMTWTDQGRPLGIVGDENHTGYLKVYQRGANDYVGTHIGKSGLPQPWKISVSIDGLTFTREADIDTITGIESGFYFKPSEGTYFDYNGEQWWIGTIQPRESSFKNDKKMILAKSDELWGKVTQKDVIFQPNIFNVMSAYVVGDIAHIYFIINKSELYYGKFDLTELANYQ